MLLLLILLPLAGALPLLLTCSENESGLGRWSCAVTGLTLLVMVLAVCTRFGESLDIPLCGIRFTLDGFRCIYGLVVSFMWFVSALLTPQYFRGHHHLRRYHFFFLLCLSFTMGVFLSADLYTTFLFFELMSLSSYAWVVQEESPDALDAGKTYLAIAVLGGLVTLMGLFLLYRLTGTLVIAQLPDACAMVTDRGQLWAAALCILFGFAAKAGLFPLHIWLPKAHPVAPAPASALLSGILTKSGVFGLIVICANLMQGDCWFGDALLTLGAITMFLGALLALFSVDLKRVIACSSLSQIGFITVGLSMMVMLAQEGSLAAYGSVMHMMNHSLIKLVLFMAAGVVYMNLHKLNLNDVRGFGRNKPLLHIVFLLGALSIACIPFVGSGYHSKSLIHESILEYIAYLNGMGVSTANYQFVEGLFVFSGGLTVAYMLKLYICLFWEKNPEHQAEYDAMGGKYMNKQTAVALLLPAVILLAFAVLPGQLLSPLGALCAPFFGQEAIGGEIAYFSGENLMGAVKSIAIGVVVYFLVVRLLLMAKDEKGVRVYVNRWPEKLDLEDLVYRPVLLKLLPGVCTLVVRFVAELPETVVVFLRDTIFSKRKKHRPVPVGNRFTYACGKAVNGVAMALNATFLKSHPVRTDFEYVFDASWKEFIAGTHLITRSVSFGLLLLCIGLYITCAYLMMH